MRTKIELIPLLDLPPLPPATPNVYTTVLPTPTPDVLPTETLSAGLKKRGMLTFVMTLVFIPILKEIDLFKEVTTFPAL